MNTDELGSLMVGMQNNIREVKRLPAIYVVKYHPRVYDHFYLKGELDKLREDLRDSFPDESDSNETSSISVGTQ